MITTTKCCFSDGLSIRDILDNCDFLPLETNTQEEYESVLEQFPFHSKQLEQQEFPKRFPFSKMVPEVYQQAMEFMYACMKFSEELTLSPNEVATMVRKAANLLLTKSFSGCLSLVFKSPGSSLALQQAIQIIIDTQYLEKAGPFLDEFVYKMAFQTAVGIAEHRPHSFRCSRRTNKSSRRRSWHRYKAMETRCNQSSPSTLLRFLKDSFLPCRRQSFDF